MEQKDTDLIDKIISSGLKQPETLTLAITSGCNMDCPHCLIDCRDVDHAFHVSQGIIKRIVQEFFELGGKRLWLTGGEPLIHPDWFEMLQFAINQTDLSEVGLQTNAVLLKEDDVSKLLSMPADRFSLQVSLDGASAGTNDLVRGDGCFDAVIKALRMLSSRGLGMQTGIAFTEMRHNYHELPDAIELIRSLGLKCLVSNTIVKAGRSTRYDWIALPTSSQIQSLIEKYCRDIIFHNLYEQYGNISAIEWFKGKGMQGMGNRTDLVCNCINTPFISADGNLYPCVMYLNNSLAVGGVHEVSLKAAIAKGLPKWAELPEISRYRSANLQECKGCAGHAHCSGGCLGRADAVNHKVLTAEDRCHLRKTVYSLDIKNSV